MITAFIGAYGRSYDVIEHEVGGSATPATAPGS
jgi:hypothetical protein